jgi:hypothetical protein
VLRDKSIGPDSSTNDDSAFSQHFDTCREVLRRRLARGKQDGGFSRVENHSGVFEEGSLSDGVEATKVCRVTSETFEVVSGSLQHNIRAGGLDLKISRMHSETEGKAAELVAHPGTFGTPEHSEVVATPQEDSR